MSMIYMKANASLQAQDKDRDSNTIAYKVY